MAVSLWTPQDHPNVDIRNVQTWRQFLEVDLHQTDNNFWEAKSQRMENMLRRMAALQLSLYIRIKGGDRKRVNEIHGWRIKEAGQGKVGKFLGSAKKMKGRDMLLLHGWVLAS